MKVSELEGVQLDYWVARAEGRADIALDAEVGPVIGRDSLNDQAGDWFEPSSNWSQGGAIIEREFIELHRSGDEWYAQVQGNQLRGGADGPTPLIAAMRAYVASKFGDEVDEAIP